MDMCRLVIAAGLLLVAATAHAEPEGVIKMRIDVPGPGELGPSLQESTSKAIADRVVERLNARMDAAEIKFSMIDRIDPSTVEVGVERELGRRLLRGLALAPGRLEIRVVRHVGVRWQRRTGDLPEAVQIRQGKTLKSTHAHLWSPTRGPLATFLEDVSFEDVDIELYGTDDGWRTLALGETVVTHHDVVETDIRRVETGSPYVSLRLRPAGRRSFHNAARHFGGELAVVLDGEIVGMLESSAMSGGALNLSAPDQIRGDAALMNWARQVAGRLAAPLPVKIVEVRE